MSLIISAIPVFIAPMLADIALDRSRGTGSCRLATLVQPYLMPTLCGVLALLTLLLPDSKHAIVSDS
jgi:hypothetical protein